MIRKKSVTVPKLIKKEYNTVPPAAVQGSAYLRQVGMELGMVEHVRLRGRGQRRRGPGRGAPGASTARRAAPAGPTAAVLAVQRHRVCGKCHNINSHNVPFPNFSWYNVISYNSLIITTVIRISVYPYY